MSDGPTPRTPELVEDEEHYRFFYDQTSASNSGQLAPTPNETVKEYPTRATLIHAGYALKDVERPPQDPQA